MKVHRNAWIDTLVALTCAVMLQAATAQPTYLKFRCPDGEYRGPEPGKTSYVKDEFTWFVTREFAKRFCMPERFIDEQLKGAEAVAWRVKPSEEVICRLRDGQETCHPRMTFELDLYLKSSLALPKAIDDVRFYWNDIHQPVSSGVLIQTNQHLINADARREGRWEPPAGSRPPFHAPTGPNEASRVTLLYLRVMPDATLNVVTSVSEYYYRADWVAGLDLVSLRSPTSGIGLGTIEHPRNPHREIRKFAIGVIRERDRRVDLAKDDQMTRRDYAHVIDLPEKLGALIADYDSRRWEQVIGPLRRAMTGQAPLPEDAPPTLPLRP